MDATDVSDVSVVGMLGATVDFNDVDELDLRTALIVGAKAEVLPATAAKIATTLTEVVENFIVLLYNIGSNNAAILLLIISPSDE
mmetsp:Transcript_14347/g.23377  ORF Transcript_14347/g.23377 Transcript_14347/m.23377 type:complete len:85 (-) Transcript_14347:157-411(-)